MCPCVLLWLSQPSMCGRLRRQDNLNPNSATVCHWGHFLANIKPLDWAPLTSQFVTRSRTCCIWQNLYCFDDILIKQTATVKPKAPRFWSNSPSSPKEYSNLNLRLYPMGAVGAWVICWSLEFDIYAGQNPNCGNGFLAI